MADSEKVSSLPSLHARIMNIRANARHIDDVACKRAYMEGHRDARHAAAELANEADAGRQELLEALEEAVEFATRRYETDFSTRERWRAAIAKATGEQQ